MKLEAIITTLCKNYVEWVLCIFAITYAKVVNYIAAMLIGYKKSLALSLNFSRNLLTMY